MASKAVGTISCPVCHSRHVPVARPSQEDKSRQVQAATCVQCGHFFKFKAVTPYKSTITLTVNGKEYTVGNKYSPSTALNGFLRDEHISVGTKHMCYQGGCGTCLVEAKLYEPISEQKLSYAVNSCLLPLYACDGMEIRTVEHIGNLHDGLHPIQKQIASYNGSQCGYCTPGQVVNMFALKEFYGTGLTKKRVEDSFDGIICRCTGYRPILQAFKDMAVDEKACNSTIGDIEDFKGKLCKTTGKQCQGSCDSSTSKPAVPRTHMVFADSQWFAPTTEEEVTSILNNNKGKKIRFLSGNTSSGVYSDLGPDNYDVVIDLSNFMELYSISFDTDVVLGSSLTITMLVDIFTRVGADQKFLLECAQLLSRVANLPIRNRGTWAGNLCMKHVHNDFPSDVYVILQVLRARIWIGFLGDDVGINDFLTYDMTGKLVQAFSFTLLDDNEMIKFYKVQPRAQNAHCYVTGGFRIKLDKSQAGFKLAESPTIAYGGIGAKFCRATKTEAYLNGKQLGDPQVLQAAFASLKSEIVCDTSPVLSSAKFRTNVAISLFYKFVLHVVGANAAPKYLSGSTELLLERPISSGEQSYDTDKVKWPVTEPLQKVEANAQACGEALYVDDMPAFPGQLEAAFVTSTVGSATLGTIDPTDALKIPGVVKVITAKDIKGQNNFMFPGLNVEEVLVSSQVQYHGQPVAIVVADSYGTALGAAYAVKVTYTNIQPPLLDLKEAINKKSFFPSPTKDVTVGNPDQAISTSANKLSGLISMGSQYHFHMETQSSLCNPTEDGMDVYTATQWIDLSQAAISQVTGLPKSSINVQVKRLGGAYGGKISRNSWIAAACGLAAQLTNRPVKLRLTLGDNMKIIGKRFPFLASYEVGYTAEGKLNGIKLTTYGDCGINTNDASFGGMATWADNAYYCPNWFLSYVAVKTNKPANTAARSPGSCPAIFIMEAIIDQVACNLGTDPTEVRLLNTYSEGQIDPLTKMALTNCHLKTNIANLMSGADYTARKQQIQQFNTANRWKKKGMSLVPLKFGIGWTGANYAAQVSIFWGDGTVAISHGGIEVGQGINTKVAQVCAYTLGIPMELVKVKASNSLVSANGVTTGGSITSENCCAAVIECCNILNGRIDPVRKKVKDPTWVNVVNECYAEGVELAARFWRKPYQPNAYSYYSYGATLAEVELDVLTGEHTLARVDILFDCGESTNPALDVGQVEGAFVMGLGYWLTEQCKFDPQSGALVTNSTWEYKPPTSKDIPVDFRVNFLKKNFNPAGILGAKACGEPPLAMSNAVLFAVKRAIEAARKDAKQNQPIVLNAPATVEVNQLLCATDPSQFLLQ